MTQEQPVEPCGEAQEPRNPGPRSSHTTPNDSEAQIRDSRSTLMRDLTGMGGVL